MSIIDKKEIFEKMHGLPALPSAVDKLDKALQDPNIDLKKVAEIVSLDAALASKIMQVVNSAFYGFSQKIASIPQAIIILGFKGVKNLSLAVSVFKLGTQLGGSDTFTIEDYWKHSLATGCIAKILSGKLRVRDPDEAFLGGLMHDVGKLVFLRYYADHYKRVLLKNKTSLIKLKDLEFETFGIDHAELGYELCKHWRIPDMLCEVVKNHHDDKFNGQSPKDEDRMIYITRIGNNLAKVGKFGFSGEHVIEEDLLHQYKESMLVSDDYLDLLSAVEDEITKAEIFLK